MLYKRIDSSKDNNIQWVDFIYPVILTYNNKLVHSSHGMTPQDADKKENHMNVKLQMEIQRKNERIYPEVKVGDNVRIYKKKKQFEKERKSVWSDNIYEINKIAKFMNQNYYFVNGFTRGFQRHEILKI